MKLVNRLWTAERVFETLVFSDFMVIFVVILLLIAFTVLLIFTAAPTFISSQSRIFVFVFDFVFPWNVSSFYFDISLLDLYQQVISLKAINPSLKVHLAVGGASAGTAPFEAITSNSMNMMMFATNAAVFLRTNGFDGLDLDWEFPGSNYRTQFTQLCEALFTSFDMEALASGQERLLLSAAVSGYKTQIEASYEPHMIHK